MGSQIEIWCNGSTTDSGSVSEGSSPSISTTILTTVMAGELSWLERMIHNHEVRSSILRPAT